MTASPTVPKRRAFVPVVALLGLAAVALFVVLRGGGQLETSVQRATPSAAPTSSYPIPSFGRPEEAKRYFDAIIEGDTRAIALLDEALAQAKTQSGTNPEQLKKLEERRAERASRLAAHQAAKP